MKMNAKVAAALNAQINNELTASYAYLSMAAFFDASGLTGFASWFREHATEEIEHGMRIYDYLVRRDVRVELKGIDTPQLDYKTPVKALVTALEMEKTVTGQIHALFDLAHEEKEFPTLTMLNWFLEEQIEEEDTFRDMVEKVEAAGDNRWHMLTLDAQLGKRGGEAD
ncbi:MAG: ferritin [Rhodobacterales bacterium]|nr:MAG: ferritin [Rhodobacterales bacterium]